MRDPVNKGGVGAESGDFLDAVFADGAGDDGVALGTRVRTALEKRLTRIFANDTNGVRIAKGLSVGRDQLLMRLYTDAEVSGDAAPSFEVAIAAIGGYGRGLAAPFSDIDLLVLHDGADQDALDGFIRTLLYPLWDAGYSVGHAVHDVASAMALADKDIAMRTSFLTRRFIAGDADLFQAFDAAFERRREKTKAAFTKAKLQERTDRRLSLSPYGRYMEPRVKDGRGGLRDIDIIDWLHAYNYQESVWSIDGPSSLLNSADIIALRKARRFLWSVRVHLHVLTNRAHDQIELSIQPALADRLGYRARNGQSATERLMTHYALISEDVDRLSRLTSLRLEEAHARLRDWRPSPTPKMLQTDEMEGRVNVRVRTGRLDFASPARAEADVLDLFRLFRALSKRRAYELHPNAVSLITKAASTFPRDRRDDPEIAEIFTASLLEAKTPGRVLRTMARTGLLGKYLPLFDRLAGRVEYGLYRQYSLDQHIFLALDFLADLRFGKVEADYSVSTSVLRAAPRILPFYLAVLLQETRAAHPGAQPGEIEDALRDMCILLNAMPEDADAVAAVVPRLDLFVRTATRRSLGETRSLIAFCREIRTREALDVLLILAVCHLRVVREDAWDDWTRGQVKALYLAARTYLEDGVDGLEMLRGAEHVALREALREIAPKTPIGEFDPFIDQMRDGAFGATPTRLLALAAKTWKQAITTDSVAAVQVVPGKDAIEAVVYAKDREGLLGDLAGAVAAAGASVRTVQAITLQDLSVVDVFVLRPPDGGASDDPAFVERLQELLSATASVTPAAEPAPARRIGDKRSIFRVAPVVNIDLEASEDCLLVEVEGLDRPGLLRDLTAALVEIGVMIKSAHIATYGEKAVDVFYLQDAPGYKITNERRIESIERRLLAALQEAPDA
ncbi:MAG: [protein-PII] uridylyltransferase [Pseudomonadota bacterium]